MKQHKQILLRNISEENQNRLENAKKRGAYDALKKALSAEPASIVDEVKKSGLRGRGGAGFSCGTKWSFIPKNNTKPVYVVLNADESEPGTFKDRLLMEKDPHAVIEGMLICAWAVQSNWSCIYIRGEYAYPYIALKKALEEAYAAGIVGDNVMGTGFKHHIVIHRGAGAYICGEETGLLESLEGRKGQPRLKPPFFPAAIGLYNCPTIVNNVETLAAVPWIIANGADAYLGIGTPQSPGTKLISASGHINKPGVYEVELGYPVLDFIQNECGGVWKGRKLKAVIPGGSSMPVLRADELNGVNLDYESLKNAGSHMGSGGFMVMDETTDMVEVARNIAHFYAHESCGQCTPCREGGHWIEKIFNRIGTGSGLSGDIQLAQSVAKNIEGHTICAFGEALSWPAQAFLRKFPEEFAAKIDSADELVSIAKKNQDIFLNYPLLSSGGH
jgi:NADH-quinone oxidoreductase subunit F